MNDLSCESKIPKYRVYETLREGIKSEVQVTQLQRSLPLWTSTQILDADGFLVRRLKKQSSIFKRGSI